MAEGCTGSSVATSSPTPPNWWDLHHHHANSLSSWTSPSSPWHQQNPSSNSSCEEDVVSISTSFTNASNHSGLTVESSRRLVEPTASSNELIGEHASDNHIWSHVLSSVGNNGDLHGSQDVGENLLEALSSKSISSTGIFEPACDYLKKMDTNWEFTNSSSTFQNFEKNLNGNFNEGLMEGDQRLTKLSNLVSNWSIAPPDPELDSQTCNISLSSSIDQYSPSGFSQVKQMFTDSISCGIGTIRNSINFPSCYGHDLKVKNENREIEVVPTGFARRSSFNGSSMVEAESKYFYGMPAHSPCSSAITYNGTGGLISVPLIDIHASNKPCLKPLNLSDCKKQGIVQAAACPGKTNGRTQGIASEGKKKRSEENSETVLKKPKYESSTVSSVKMQAPKVKLGDRITALQQIVSPFGKTDTASVLLEAIGYIKFLQEQVQLLSNPYMKTNSHKKDPWGNLDRKDKADAKVDLRSRGLCLVPVSCTPQIYRENTGTDYWTPTYRGCLYR